VPKPPLNHKFCGQPCGYNFKHTAFRTVSTKNLVLNSNRWSLWATYLFHSKWQTHVFTKKEYITVQLISTVQRQYLMLPDSRNLISAVSRSAMSYPRSSRRFCATQFRFQAFNCSDSILQYILITSPYFDNFEFDIFDASSSQCHFDTSVTIAIRIQRISAHLLKLNLVC